MGRIARVVVPGCPHHVTQRGNHRQAVFFSDADRLTHLRILADQCHKHQLRILAWCQMTNHVHLIAVPVHNLSLALAMGRAHNDYARWVHIQNRQTGHLWQNRFYSCPLDNRHVWDAILYVETNPVRAGLVKTPTDWPWSSARAHLSGDDPFGLLDLNWWRAECPAARRSDWWDNALSLGFSGANILERIREATRTGRPFGDTHFTLAIERRLGRSLLPQKRGPKPKSLPAQAQMSFGIS